MFEYQLYHVAALEITRERPESAIRRIKHQISVYTLR